MAQYMQCNPGGWFVLAVIQVFPRGPLYSSIPTLTLPGLFGIAILGQLLYGWINKCVFPQVLRLQ